VISSMLDNVRGKRSILQGTPVAIGTKLASKRRPEISSSQSQEISSFRVLSPKWNDGMEVVVFLHSHSHKTTKQNVSTGHFFRI